MVHINFKRNIWILIFYFFQNALYINHTWLLTTWPPFKVLDLPSFEYVTAIKMKTDFKQPIP